MGSRNGPLLKSWSEKDDLALRVGAARGRSAFAISVRLGRSVPAVYHRAGKLGIKLQGQGRKDQRPMPADFPANAHLPATELRTKYRAGTTVVRRWLSECGVYREAGELHRGKPNCNRKPMPADFREVFTRLGWNGTREHYRCGAKALDRWIAEAGMMRAHRAAAMKPKPQPRVNYDGPAHRPVTGDWFLTPPPGYHAAKRVLPPVRSLYGTEAH